MGVKQEFKYKMLNDYRFQNSKEWLALAEFIDNSIASYLDKKPNNQENVAGLIVTIRIKDNTITVLDNANGMNRNELENALKLHNTEGKNNTGLNQFGVGMKMGIFWFGQDVQIYSKAKNHREQKLEIFTSDESILNDEVIYEAHDSNENEIKTESGTLIKIMNVHKTRKIHLKDIYFIRDCFNWRYKRQLTSVNSLKKGMQLIFEVWDKTNDRFEEIKCESSNNVSFRLNHFLSNNEKNKKDFSIDIRDRLNNDIEQLKQKYNLYNNIDVIDVYDVRQTKDDILKKSLLSIFIEKLENDEPLEYTQKIKLEKKVIIDLHFGLISNEKSLQNVCGLSIFHAGRAIHHPPNDSKTSQSSFTFTPTGSTQRMSSPTWRWLYGEIDLTGVYEPDNNKSGIQWPKDPEHVKENLLQTLTKIWESLKEFIQIFVNINNEKKVSRTNNKQKEIIAKNSKDVIDENMFLASLEEKEDNSYNEDLDEEEKYLLYQTNDKKLKIYIDEYDGDDNSNLISFSDEGDKIKLSFNINHRFIKPAFDTNGKVQSVKEKTIYPFMLLIALCCEKFNNASLKNSIFSEKFPELDLEKKLEETINIISEKISRK